MQDRYINHKKPGNYSFHSPKELVGVDTKYANYLRKSTDEGSL